MLSVRYSLLVLGAAVGLAPSGGANAHQVQSRALEVVPWHVRVDPGAVRPGGVARLVFQAALGDSENGPWRMYALDSPLPTRAVNVVLDELPQGLEPIGEMEQWGAMSGFDVWFDTTVTSFKKRVLLWRDLQVESDAAEGSQEVQGTISFMACNDRVCLPPASWTFGVTFDIERTATGALPATPPHYDPDVMSSMLHTPVPGTK